MTKGTIPDAVKRLIAERIDSVPELEAVLLLREERERWWTAVDAGQRLYVSTTAAAYILSVLTERGFFVCEDEKYRYGPQLTDLDSLVDALATSYSESLIDVTAAIHAKPSPSVREFADVFRLRKDK